MAMASSPEARDDHSECVLLGCKRARGKQTKASIDENSSEQTKRKLKLGGKEF